MLFQLERELHGHMHKPTTRAHTQTIASPCAETQTPSKAHTASGATHSFRCETQIPVEAQVLAPSEMQVPIPSQRLM